MAKVNRFAEVLKATEPEPEPPAPAPDEPVAPVGGKVPGWEPAQVEDEPLQRLNVEIPRSLHQRLKAKALGLGKTKRELVIALLEWALEDEE